MCSTNLWIPRTFRQKKIPNRLFLIPLIFFFSIVSSSAGTYRNLTYTISGDQIIITDCDPSASGRIVIPEKIEGKNVTKIERYAFADCTGITSIAIPDSTKDISYYAFSGCSSLSTITIPNSITNIANYAFLECSSLTSISIPSSVTRIGIGTFKDCTSLSIATFYGNAPSSLGNDAFSNTHPSFSIRYSNTSNGFSTPFWNGYTTTAVDLTDPYLVLTYTISENKVTITDCNTAASGLLIVPGVIEGIPVTRIGYRSFQGCSSLTSVIIPSDVTEIDDGAFHNCNSLTTVNIPETTSSIGSFAFSGCSSLTSMFLPNSLTSLGKSTFQGCASLTSLYISNNLTAIESEAFRDCSSLSSLTIPEGVTIIEPYAFYGCSTLPTISIPNSVKYIGDHAFSDCSSVSSFHVGEANTFFQSIDGILFNSDASELLTFPQSRPGDHYTIPSGVSTINQHAFRLCTSIGSVTIPNSVESIGSYAFFGCSSLSSITLPESITSIGAGAFRSCSSLAAITIPDTVTNIGMEAFSNCTTLAFASFLGNVPSLFGTKVFANAHPAFTIRYLDTATGFTSPTWKGHPAGVLLNPSEVLSYTISGGKATITGCDRTSEGILIIPSIVDGAIVSSIEESAFYQCSSLAHISLPGSINSIGSRAFQHCSSLSFMAIPDGVTHFEDFTFADCSSLGTIVLPKSFTNLGAHTISGCSSLNSIQVESSNPHFNSLDGVLLSNDLSKLLVYPPGKSTNTYSIPHGVNTIDFLAFRDCVNLTSISIPDSVSRIGPSAFLFCSSLAFISIPDSVTTIESYTFSGCSSLVSVLIPHSVTAIGDFAFRDCSSLTSASIPSGVTSIESSTFSGCSSLVSVSIPDSVTAIGDFAFRDCSSLDSISIHRSVTNIGNSAFSGCSSLTFFHVESNNPYFQSVNGTLFTANLFEILAYPPGKPDQIFTIPDSVTTIGSSAFETCSNLVSISIPESVTNIQRAAFKDCIALTSISIPDSVTTIESYAFRGCSSLTSASLPDSVTSIKSGAFNGCTSLAFISIPESVTEIGNTAFFSCPSLKNVTFEGDAPSVIGAFVFHDAHPSFIVHYRSSAKGFSSPTWKGYPAEMIDEVRYPAANWLLAHGLPHNSNLNQDTNSDGISLLMAYSLNLNPNSQLGNRMPKATFSNGVISFRYYSSTSGITYRVETSANMVDWTEIGLSISEPDDHGYRTATTLPGDTSGFIRLKVIME